MQKFYFLAAFMLLVTGAGAQDYRFGKVSVEELQEKNHPQDEEADAAILYRSQSVYYEYSEHNGFTLVTDVHERVKIYTKEGFDWATKEISYFQNSNDEEKVTSIKGYTYNLKDGRIKDEKLKGNGIFEEEESDYRLTTKLTMPAVQEGSVIEYKYTLRSPFVTSIDDTPLQNLIPINRLEVRITIPEFLVYRKYLNTKSPLNLPISQGTKPFLHLTHSTNSNADRLEFLQNTYEINASDVPALKDEDYVDYLHNYAAYIKWELISTRFPNSMIKNYSVSWDDVAKGIYDDGGFQKEVSRDGFFKKDVDKIIEGVNSPLERAALIYSYVKEKVKWNGYYGFTAENGGKSAFQSGEGNVGDINLLLTAMLKYAGLNASPVVVSTRNNGIPVYPTRNGFNYVVSAIEMPNNNNILLDATDPHAAIGELPSRARNWQGRIIRENETSEWINLNPQVLSQETSILSYEVGEDMVLRGKSISVENGLFAKAYREKFGGLNDQSLLENLEKGKGNIKVSEINQENLKKVGEDVKETYDFELQQGMDVINGKIYLKPFIFNGLAENPFKADERNFPIFFDFPMLRTATVNVLIPEGYEVESMPESLITTINGGEGEFKFLANQNGRFLRLQAEFGLKNIIFLPSQYQALKEFYAQMVEKQSEAIVLKKTI
ncbi:DUF3857 domain-containing protein [Salinimicrobium oceani]|uniref:DUF3857 and transglutaminase domain-containing protein n=1 Tax=Salinimicrobium oceani TaxID=2722702 RepID=A0ABX1D0R3_9FLAO|nr:DUF3857 and transglutaminase domain-containing protein [Salinimicrobium oceani]NJW54080.1 DUF3857 and transglutaminase domain-containing protein [Salinimicrobium oceani]